MFSRVQIFVYHARQFNNLTVNGPYLDTEECIHMPIATHKESVGYSQGTHQLFSLRNIPIRLTKTSIVLNTDVSASDNEVCLHNINSIKKRYEAVVGGFKALILQVLVYVDVLFIVLYM